MLCSHCITVFTHRYNVGDKTPPKAGGELSYKNNVSHKQDGWVGGACQAMVDGKTKTVPYTSHMT